MGKNIDNNGSLMKKTAAGVGLALMVPSTFAGAANALTASEAKPLDYKGAVSAEEYSKSSYEISIDYSALDATVKAVKAKGVKVSEGQAQVVTAGNDAEGRKLAEAAKKESVSQIDALKQAVAAVEQNKAAEAKYEADSAAAAKKQAEADAVKAENAKIADENKAIAAENDKIKAANDAKRKEADAKNAAALKAYEEAKAVQDKLKAEQVTNANPLKGIVDAKNLAVEQPFEVVENDNNLVSINGAAPQDNLTERTDFANDWSSANTYRFTNLDGSNPNLSLKYKDAAVDKETGRKLTAQVDVVRFVSNPNGAPYNADGSAKWNNLIDVHSSFQDIISFQKIYNMELKVTLTYSDDGSAYNKQYYLTPGSLNAQQESGATAATRYEFTGPGKGVIATFLNSESRINKDAQALQGTAATLPGAEKSGFYILQGSNQGGVVFDETEDALKYLGVTYLVNNGATFYVGTTGNPGVPGEDGVSGDPKRTGASEYSPYSIDASYNHLMLSARTVAPTLQDPVKPKLITPDEAPLKPLKPLKPVPTVPEVQKPTPKPVPEVKVEKKVIKVSNVAPEKTVTNEDIIIPAGNDLPTQTVTGNTGSKEPEQFAITDLIEYGKDGDGNWRKLVSISKDKLKVVDSEGKDVTSQFDIVVEEGKLISGTGTDFDGHVADTVTATAKDPKSLGANKTYSLKVESKSLNDFKADEMRDLGVVTINNQPIVTSIHRVKEVVGQVNKELTTPASEIKPGATLRWKAQAKNSSGADMKNAVISEFPDNAQFDLSSVRFINTNGRGTVNGNVWEIGELKAGETVEFEVEVTLLGNLDMARVASEGILNTIVLTNNATPEDPAPTTPPNQCQVNATVDEDTDGCDATVTKVTPPPAPETPEPGKPTEPAKPQEPKSIEKAKAETGATGYGDSGLSPMTAAGIGLLLIGSVGATTVAVRSTKKRKASAE